MSVSLLELFHFCHECVLIRDIPLLILVRVCVCYTMFSLLLVPTGLDGRKEKHFTDRDVCRPFLLDICINDLFTNTVRMAVVPPLIGTPSSRESNPWIRTQ